MSKNLVDTEVGGEQTQYEGAHTFTEPHAKEAGQLGETKLNEDPASGTSSSLHKPASNAPNAQGVTPADKIRYGQSIQQDVMCGKTTGFTGHASTEGSFGGTEALGESTEGFANERREQGYGGGRDMEKNIGA
ncbi:hypothetical protein K469DRAFT_390431 [Zopfia rhizophila CBS 207.26]|uniref:Uncharacterized protein n=1 Tax=Zopfia rhizophila CBS 207.26 TaxID=1314779 RepID=A0A6A6EKQ1_9PEZI|nr:hypothetical protein K469DRAFT_390431 [Zopfia rhizophila CBS 207.26]